MDVFSGAVAHEGLVVVGGGVGVGKVPVAVAVVVIIVVVADERRWIFDESVIEQVDDVQRSDEAEPHDEADLRAAEPADVPEDLLHLQSSHVAG